MTFSDGQNTLTRGLPLRLRERLSLARASTSARAPSSTIATPRSRSPTRVVRRDLRRARTRANPRSSRACRTRTAASTTTTRRAPRTTWRCTRSRRHGRRTGPPILSTQLTATALLLDGFQANPYRAVRIGRAAAQEYHPENRARYAAGLAGRLWIAPLSGAVQPALRVYRDTWDIRVGQRGARLRAELFAGAAAARARPVLHAERRRVLLRRLRARAGRPATSPATASSRR